MLAPLRLLLLCLAVPAILLAMLLHFALDDRPLVDRQWSPDYQDAQRARQIFQENLASESAVRTLKLTEKDLNVATNYLLSRHFDSAAEVHMKPAGLRFVITLGLKSNLFGDYLNIRFDLQQRQNFLKASNLRIGSMNIADEFSGFILDTVIRLTPLQQYSILAGDHIDSVRLNNGILHIAYRLDPEQFARLSNLLALHSDHEALAVYQQRLAEVVARHDRSWRLSLAQLLQPLFRLAYQRSTLNDAIEVNKHVIHTVNAYVNRDGIQRFLSGTVAADTDKLSVFLYRRIDMAKHFIASAALSASGNGHLVQKIGEEKELNDAWHGSGFSFIDLAADRAGRYFGEMATASPQAARKIQKKMAKIQDYRAFMPDVTDLPESLSGQEFEERFQDTDSPAYRRIIQQIDARIAACPIYR